MSIKPLCDKCKLVKHPFCAPAEERCRCKNKQDVLRINSHTVTKVENGNVVVVPEPLGSNGV